MTLLEAYRLGSIYNRLNDKEKSGMRTLMYSQTVRIQEAWLMGRLRERRGL